MAMQGMSSAPARDQQMSAGTKASKVKVPTSKTQIASAKSMGKAPVSIGTGVAGFGGGKPDGSTINGASAKTGSGGIMGSLAKAGAVPGLHTPPLGFQSGLMSGKV